MISKWKIFYADLNPVIGSEKKGIRAVLIIIEYPVNFSEHTLEV